MLRRMPAPGESDSQLNLRELVSHPHVVEVLDALSHGPMTLAEIRSPRAGAYWRGAAACCRPVAW